MRRLLPALLLCSALLPAIAWGVTARDLSSRIQIDGFTSDFTDDERVFQFNPVTGALEEAVDDSKWGVSNDINQIRVTWDAHNLYLGGEGVIWGNNMVLFIDSIPRRGLADMTNLNSWRRNFFFDTTGVSQGAGFSPDLFLATWDTNTSPHLIVQKAGNNVDDELSGGYFRAAATFSQGTLGRAMEAAIPWRTIFLGSVGFGTRDTVMTVGGIRDTFMLFPPGTQLKLCGVVTGGADGTGGPDSAPDNLRGFTNNANDAALLDNWAILDIDRNDDTGLGNGGPDGVADWGVEPLSRVSFHFRPPIVALRFSLSELRLDRPAFAPDRGERVHFTPALSPRLDPSNAIDQVRTVNLSANVYDMHGQFVRNLYINETRMALHPTDSNSDVWDGRDSAGRIVPPGIYILRSVLEPSLSRFTRSVVVVR